MPDDRKNQLFFGDNLDVLRRHVADESVDLVYLDPPFNSAANYNVLFQEKSGEQSAAQIEAFEDTWKWTREAEEAFRETVTCAPERVVRITEALRGFLGTSDMMAYLTMMTPRLLELHRVLKRTGSIYLHCDPTASHYLKLVLDAVFGSERFRSEIIWQRTHAHNDAKRNFAFITDSIFYYVKGDDYSFKQQYTAYKQEYLEDKYRFTDSNGRRYMVDNLRSPSPRPNLTYEYKGYRPHPNGWAVSLERMKQLDADGRLEFPKGKEGRIRVRRYLDEQTGMPLGNLWTDIPPINSQAKERLGYPTQKPEALLERIVRASSGEGDLVLDPFCGCGTSISVAERLHRRWIGIDITHVAISLIRSRLSSSFGGELAPYEVLGVPTDAASAEALALEDRYKFQWWAVGLVEGRPAQDKKRGKDTGVDGFVYFFDDNSGRAKKIVVQVKSGGVRSGDIRDLKGVVEREGAQLGAFLTLRPPTRDMEREALSAKFYESEFYGHFPKIQILTIEQLLSGRRLQYPRVSPATFKRAERQTKARTRQAGLFAPRPDDEN